MNLKECIISNWQIICGFVFETRMCQNRFSHASIIGYVRRCVLLAADYPHYSNYGSQLASQFCIVVLCHSGVCRFVVVSEYKLTTHICPITRFWCSHNNAFVPGRRVNRLVCITTNRPSIQHIVKRFMIEQYMPSFSQLSYYMYTFVIGSTVICFVTLIIALPKLGNRLIAYWLTRRKKKYGFH